MSTTIHCLEQIIQNNSLGLSRNSFAAHGLPIRASQGSGSDLNPRGLMGMANRAKACDPVARLPSPRWLHVPLASGWKPGLLGSDWIPTTRHVQSSPASDKTLGVPDTGIGRIADLGPCLDSTIRKPWHNAWRTRRRATPLRPSPMPASTNPSVIRPRSETIPYQDRLAARHRADFAFIYNQALTDSPHRCFRPETTWRNSAANPNYKGRTCTPCAEGTLTRRGFLKGTTFGRCIPGPGRLRGPGGGPGIRRGHLRRDGSGGH